MNNYKYMDELITYLGKENVFKYNDYYRLQYIDNNTYNDILTLISKARFNKEINGEDSYRIRIIYKNIYENGKKLKILIENEPRLHAQRFIGKKNIREFIFRRDKVCLCCGTDKKLSLDHIIPVNKGGENKISNLQTLCSSCNSRKSDKYKDYRK